MILGLFEFFKKIPVGGGWGGLHRFTSPYRYQATSQIILNLIQTFFADDTKFYTRVEDHRDAIKTQNDFNQLNLWSEKWLLKFHPDTSSVILIRTIQYGG